MIVPRYIRLGADAPRTARRLVGYLLTIWRLRVKVIWYRLDVVMLVEWMGVSRATVWRAIQYLRENGYLEWRTVYSVDGHGVRGAWETLVALPERLMHDRQPLHRDRSGRERHVRLHLRGPDIVPAVVSESHAIYGSGVNSAEITRQRAVGVRAPIGLRACVWWIVRALERLHGSKPWRVSFDLRSTVGWVTSWLMCGMDSGEIWSAYVVALDRQHATATDVWLLGGQRSKAMFNQSSTFGRASRRLERMRAKGSGMFRSQRAA